MNAKADLKRLKLAANIGMVTIDGMVINSAQPEDPPAARTEVRDDGVYYIGTKIDSEDGSVIELPPLWLCDRLEIIGRGIDESRESYRALRWHSRGSHQEQTLALNLGMVGERLSWSVLRRGGLAIGTSRRPLEFLASWLQTGGDDLMHSISHRGGWNLGAYVLPSGEVIGEPSGPLFYNGDRSHAHAFQPHGSVEGWRDGVAKLCSGNSRPMLAIGAAMGASLLHLVGLESGGFHFYGPSGCGKTTSANVGASVWGHPHEQVLNWDATALALANAAAARNDGLMLLDEIGQGNPEAVSMAAYRLFNGTGKMQGAREGGNREMLRWRVLVLSTGEVDLTSVMQGGGRRTRAGQEVRLASLPADAGFGMGCFERLNGQTDSNRLAKALDKATQEHYGAAGRAVVAYIAERREAVAIQLKAAINAAMDDLPSEASGQVRRVAARFAVAGEALEIATEAGLTGWRVKEGCNAVRRCFSAWLDRYGLGNREDEQIISQAEGWFSAHAYSRFIDWHDLSKDRKQNVFNLAGYRRNDGHELFFLVNPAVFVDEIAEGFDKTAAADVLARVGMLQKAGDGKSTGTHRTPDWPDPRRFYKFVRTNRTE